MTVPSAGVDRDGFDVEPQSHRSRKLNRRWLVPAGAVAFTAIGVVVAAVPGVASGEDHPALPPRTAAELLADLHGLDPAPFSGTVVETARLGLPSLPGGELAGAAGSSAGSIQQAVTLLTGSHTAQVSYGGPEQQRVALFLSDSSETDIVHNGKDVWTYQSDGNAVTHFTAEPGDKAAEKTPAAVPAVTPQDEAQQILAAISPSTAVTVDLTAKVAGRSAYQLDLAPKATGSTISSVRIAIDAATHVPLRVQIWGADSSGAPALEIGYTSFSLSAPGARTFEFSIPSGAKVTEESDTAKDHTGTKDTTASKASVVGSDWTSVLVVPADTKSGPAPNGKASGSELSGVLSDMATQVAGGQLVHTVLFNVLLSDDGRIAIGAVQPSLLSQALAGKSAG